MTRKQGLLTSISPKADIPEAWSTNVVMCQAVLNVSY